MSPLPDPVGQSDRKGEFLRIVKIILLRTLELSVLLYEFQFPGSPLQTILVVLCQETERGSQWGNGCCMRNIPPPINPYTNALPSPSA